MKANILMALSVVMSISLVFAVIGWRKGIEGYGDRSTPWVPVFGVACAIGCIAAAVGT